MESLHPEPPVPAGPASSPPGGDPPATSPGSLPAPPPAWWLLVLFLAITLPLFVAGIAVGAVVGPANALLVAAVGTQLSFLLPALAWARLSGYRPVRLLRLARPRPAALIVGLVVGAGSIAAGGGLTALWQGALQASVMERFDVGRDLMGQGWSPALLFLLAALLPPLCEEIAFRGALQASLLRGRTPARAVAIGALAFASAHFDPVRFPGVLLLGLAFGWLAWRTGSIWPSMLAHAVNNGAAVLLYLAARPGESEAAGPSERLTAPEAAAGLAFGLALLALAASAARRWLPPAPAAESFLEARGEAPAQSSKYLSR